MDKQTKFKVKRAINEFKLLRWYCRDIIEYRLTLEELNHQILNISHHQEPLTKEQMKSSLPMPTSSNHGGVYSPLGLMLEIEKVEKELTYSQSEILKKGKKFERLDKRDLDILCDLYFYFHNQWDVAEKYGYTRQSLMKHLYKVISNIL